MQARVDLAVGIQQDGVIGEAIQQSQVAADCQKGEVLGLPVDIDEQRAQLAHQRQAYRPPVHPPGGAPLQADLAAEGERAGIILQLLALEDLEHGCGKGGGELEGGFDAGAGGAAADAGGIRLAADDRLDGIQDDRFARAGLAGEDVQAGVEPQLELLDDGEVLDPQALQHGLFFTELETGDAVIGGGRGGEKVDALHDQRVEIHVESKEVIEEIDHRR